MDPLGRSKSKYDWMMGSRIKSLLETCELENILFVSFNLSQNYVLVFYFQSPHLSQCLAHTHICMQFHTLSYWDFFYQCLNAYYGWHVFSFDDDGDNVDDNRSKQRLICKGVVFSHTPLDNCLGFGTSSQHNAFRLKRQLRHIRRLSILILLQIIYV